MSNGLDDNKIRQTAEGPAEVEVDGQRVKQQSVRDQIAVDRYLAAKEAVNRPKRGLRFSKLVPPGSV